MNNHNPFVPRETLNDILAVVKHLHLFYEEMTALLNSCNLHPELYTETKCVEMLQQVEESIKSCGHSVIAARAMIPFEIPDPLNLGIDSTEYSEIGEILIQRYEAMVGIVAESRHRRNQSEVDGSNQAQAVGGESGRIGGMGSDRSERPSGTQEALNVSAGQHGQAAQVVPVIVVEPPGGSSSSSANVVEGSGVGGTTDKQYLTVPGPKPRSRQSDDAQINIDYIIGNVEPSKAAGGGPTPRAARSINALRRGRATSSSTASRRGLRRRQ